MSLFFCGVLSLTLFQVFQEFRFAGQPQEEIADQIVGLLRRLAAGAEAEEQAGDDRAMGTHDSESRATLSTRRVERRRGHASVK